MTNKEQLSRKKKLAIGILVPIFDSFLYFWGEIYG